MEIPTCMYIHIRCVQYLSVGNFLKWPEKRKTSNPIKHAGFGMPLRSTSSIQYEVVKNPSTVCLNLVGWLLYVNCMTTPRAIGIFFTNFRRTKTSEWTRIAWDRTFRKKQHIMQHSFFVSSHVDSRFFLNCHQGLWGLSWGYPSAETLSPGGGWGGIAGRLDSYESLNQPTLLTLAPNDLTFLTCWTQQKVRCLPLILLAWCVWFEVGFNMLTQ